jgi:hypothetical protein
MRTDRSENTPIYLLGTTAPVAAAASAWSRSVLTSYQDAGGKPADHRPNPNPKVETGLQPAPQPEMPPNAAQAMPATTIPSMAMPSNDPSLKRGFGGTVASFERAEP